MILKHISILNYKNLEQVELAFSPKLNTFFGQNGMGKTNLLDAVYFLSFCKSAGNPIDSQNIRLMRISLLFRDFTRPPTVRRRRFTVV